MAIKNMGATSTNTVYTGGFVNPKASDVLFYPFVGVGEKLKRRMYF